jgi:DNA-directed RNA polymerase sigma subunit (sigma70/sigma32)
MECAGQKNGFVTFKRSKNLDINDKEHDDEGNKKASTIKIPSHIRDKLGKLTTTRTDSKPEKRSHEYRSEAEKLRAEIEEMKRKAKTLRSNMER